jgi:hypothetical protein
MKGFQDRPPRQPSPNNPQHVLIERLRAVMLGTLALDETEHVHVMHCTWCSQKMAESVLDEFRNKPENDQV